MYYIQYMQSMQYLKIYCFTNFNWFCLLFTEFINRIVRCTITEIY